MSASPRWANLLVLAGIVVFFGALVWDDPLFDTAAVAPQPGAPPGLPPMYVPPDNPPTAAAAELGRHLFYDPRLSVNGTIACASCHRQELAFTDGRRLSPGATGELTTRNAMSLANVGYNGVFTWADNRLTRLEEQALVPLLGEHPLEMGLAGNEAAALARLAADERYPDLFRAAYGEDSISFDNVVRALATFQRGLVSFATPYDRYRAGERDALSPVALRGQALFFSDRLNCFRCHGGANFRFTPGHRSDEDDTSVAYHNTGLYNVGGAGDYPARDQGLYVVTGEPADRGKFKAPTLRNIAVTAPYMHDGSIATLRDVLAHYARGGRLVEAGEDAGDGRLNPLKSELVTGFELTEAELEAVLAFLHSLTDEAFLAEERFSDPLRDLSSAAAGDDTRGDAGEHQADAEHGDIVADGHLDWVAREGLAAQE